MSKIELNLSPALKDALDMVIQEYEAKVKDSGMDLDQINEETTVLAIKTKTGQIDATVFEVRQLLKGWV